MANIKTITLGGTEQKVIISGQNCDIRNDGADTICASAQPNITAGADGVLAIPVGQAAKLLDTRGTVYLKGTGIVQICGSDYSDLVFKSAPAGGGSGGTVDDIARNMASANAASISALRGDVEDVQTVAENISNSNLLINPDFKINQRGQTEYIGSNEKNIYTVDGWKILQYSPNIKVTVNDGYITLENSGDETQYVAQSLENPIDDAHTISAKILGSDNVLSGNKIATDDFTIMYERANNWLAIHIAAHTAVSLEWVKMEHGSVATPFVPPHPTTELAKCQRYFYSTYQGVPAGTPNSMVNELVLTAVTEHRFNAVTIDLPVKMRTTPTVTFYDPQTGAEGYAAKSGDSDNPAVIFQMSTGADRLIIGSENLTVGTDYYLHYTASAEL